MPTIYVLALDTSRSKLPHLLALMNYLILYIAP